jgi:hypothetical protein
LLLLSCLDLEGGENKKVIRLKLKILSTYIHIDIN